MQTTSFRLSNAGKLWIAAGVIIAGVLVTIFASSGITIENTTTYEQIDLEKYREISHTLGSPQAPVTIIEFGDYQCPFYSDWYKEVKSDLSEQYIDKGDVELIFVDFPFLGPDSYPAAYASFCAEEQGKYWEYHEIMYLNQQQPNDGWASSESIRGFAQEIGLNIEQFDECTSGTKYNKKVDANLEASKKHGINQTPTFLVIDSIGNTQKIEGKQPLVVFEEIISELRT